MPGFGPTELIIICIVFLMWLLPLLGVGTAIHLLLRWFHQRQREYKLDIDRNLDSKPGVAIKPIRILFLASNPVQTEPLALAEEVRAIDQALRAGQFRDRYELEQQWAVRTTDLQEFLLRYTPHIVHFSGHGTPASQIILTDDSGKIDPVPNEALAQLFALMPGNIQCVLLNACYSESQARAIAESVGCVIGMSGAITDGTAIIFVAAFYRALAYGQNFKSAFDLAVSQLKLEGLQKEQIPVSIILGNNSSNLILVN